MHPSGEVGAFLHVLFPFVPRYSEPGRQRTWREKKGNESDKETEGRAEGSPRRATKGPGAARVSWERTEVTGEGRTERVQV